MDSKAKAVVLYAAGAASVALATAFIVRVGNLDKNSGSLNSKLARGKRGSDKDILKLIKQISGEQDLKHAIDGVIEGATFLLHADRVSLFFVDHVQKSLIIGISKGSLSRDVSKLASIRIPLNNSSIAGHVALSGQTVVCNDPYSDPRFDSSIDRLTGYKTASLIAVPLRNAAGRVVAVLQGLNKVDRKGFEQQDIQLIGSVADCLGSVLHRLQLSHNTATARRRTEELMSVMRDLHSENDSNAVIRRIIDSTYRLLSAQRVTLFLVDDSRKFLIISASQDAEGVRIPISNGLAGYVATTGNSINIPDAYDDERFDQSVDAKTGFRTRSVLCVPVRDATGRVIAVLQAINRQEPAADTYLGAIFGRDVSVSETALVADEADDAAWREADSQLLSPRSAAAKRAADQTFSFTLGDLSLLETMGNIAGIVLRKAQMLEELERSQRTTAALLDVVKCVSSDSDVDSLVSNIVAATYKLLNAERVSLYLVDSAREELYIAVSQDAAGVRIKLGEGIAGYVAQSGETLNIQDAYRDSRFNKTLDTATGFKTRSVLCMPVRLARTEAPVAVLQAINKLRAPFFSNEDESAMAALCMEVALALKRKSVDAAFMRVLGGRQSGDNRQATIDVSLLSMYCGDQTAARLYTAVKLERIAIEPEAWPRNFSANRVKDIDSRLLSWDFDPFKFTPNDLLVQVVAMLQQFDILARFRVDETALKRFLVGVKARYRENPFHNFFHGFTVMHTVFLFLLHTKASSVLQYLDIFAALIAALCHDIDHPGVNNSYLINSADHLAIVHNDDSVLERHHAQTTFELLAQEGCNIFASLSREEFKQVRHIIIRCILGTDISKHEGQVKAMAARVAACQADNFACALDAMDGPPGRLTPQPPQPTRVGRRASSIGSLSSEGYSTKARRRSSLGFVTLEKDALSCFDRNNKQDREELMEYLVHTADLSGQAYSFNVGKQWGERVLEEFVQQARHESEKGLPVLPFMANLDQPIARARLQATFLGSVVLPLWQRLDEAVQGLSTPISNLKTILMHHENEIRKIESQHTPDELAE